MYVDIQTINDIEPEFSMYRLTYYLSNNNCKKKNENYISEAVKDALITELILDENGNLLTEDEILNNINEDELNLLIRASLMDNNGTLLYSAAKTSNFREQNNISCDKNGKKSSNISNEKILTKTKPNDIIPPKTIPNHKVVRFEFRHTNSDSNSQIYTGTTTSHAKTIIQKENSKCAIQNNLIPPKTVPNQSSVRFKFKDSNSDLIPPKTVPNQKSVRFKFKDSNSDSDSQLYTDLNSNEKKILYS